MKSATLILFGICFTIQSYSQNKQADSLMSALKQAKEDTNKVNTLNALSRSLWQRSDTINGMKYANQALSLAEKIGFKRGEASAYQNIGMIYQGGSQLHESIKYLRLALNIRKTMTNMREIASSHQGLGQSYLALEQYPEALDNLYTALKLYEDAGNKRSVRNCMNSIATIYAALHNYSEQLKMCQASLKISEELNDKQGIATSYWGIAQIYLEQQLYEEAIAKCDTFQSIAKELNDSAGISWSYSLLGTINEEYGQSLMSAGNHSGAAEKRSIAMKNYLVAQAMFKRLNDNTGLAGSLEDIGKNYLNAKEYSKAQSYFKQSLDLFLESGLKEYISSSYKLLAQADSALHNYQSAYFNYQQHIVFRDSLVNDEQVRKAEGFRLRYEFDKKEDSLRQEHQLTATKLAAQKKQRVFYWSGLAMLAALLFFAFLSFRNQKKINRLKDEAHAREKKDMELQHQNVVMNERLRISRELHDEVGATLSGIAMYSHLAKEQIKNSNAGEIEKSLNIMQQSSGEMVNKLNDIVWLINPEQDSLKKLLERLEEYAKNMASVRNMQVRITMPGQINELSLPIENRRNIYLFCKEAINNAVKYSGASLLELSVKETDGELEFSISDNGKGFDAVMVKRGNGLDNMQKRADEVGAKLSIYSKKDLGAQVAMQLKIT